jgi:hypothetical protein
VQKKNYKQKFNSITSEIKNLKEKIEGIDASISISEILVKESDQNEPELLINLMKTLDELKIEKLEISKLISEKEKELSNTNILAIEEEKNLEDSIEIKKEKFSNIESNIKQLQIQTRETTNEMEALIAKNSSKFNEIIQVALKKYPLKSNLFNLYVNKICTGIGQAISASEHNAFNEIAYFLDGIRDSYRKVFQVIFDSLLKKQEVSLGRYLGDMFNREKLRSLFNNRNIKVNIIQKLVNFHEIINAISHKGENGKEKSKNINLINSFKIMKHNEREDLMMAIPEFFNSILFSKAEVNTFLSKLKL